MGSPPRDELMPDDASDDQRSDSDDGDEHAVDPMAPGRSLVDPDIDEAIEPNEPA